MTDIHSLTYQATEIPNIGMIMKLVKILNHGETRIISQKNAMKNTVIIGLTAEKAIM